jgi:hypothetical protein
MAIRATTKLGAEVLDIHTEKLRQAFGEIAALRESQFPRYTDAVVSLPLECETPEIADMPWAAHDAAVSDAIAHALPGPNAAEKLSQNAAQECPTCGSPDPAAKPVVDTGAKLEFQCDDLWHAREWYKSGGGVRLPDPESAPFFTQSGPGVAE